MTQSYDQWQGDEGTYFSMASRVADGHLPYIDWSPGFTLLYAPFITAGLEGANAQIAIRIVSSLALLLVFGFTAYRVLRKPWLAALLTLAIAAHPMLSVGMTLRVFTGAVVASILLASTYDRKGIGYALIIIATATLIRPEFWIVYAFALVSVIVWYRSRTYLPLVAASFVIAAISWSFVQLGPAGSNYPGGRALQAIGQHYALFDSTPNVDPWNEWGVPFRRDFGDATTALQMYRTNDERFVAYVSWNLRSVPTMAMTAYRYTDRTAISRLTGALIIFIVVSAAALYMVRSRADLNNVNFTILLSVLVFSMMLPWVITGTDSMIAAPFSPAILILLGASIVYLMSVFRNESPGVKSGP